MINRFKFLEALSRPFGRDLLTHRTVDSVMDAQPLVVDAGTSAEALSHVLVDDGSRYIFDGFIVTQEGRYLGVGTGYTLMRQLTERKQAELFHRAHHDPLTGLPNRQLFGDRLTQALARAGRHGLFVGLLYLDVDRFKSVNDTLGHRAGDALLQALTTRVLEIVRAEDTFARLSGDEFALVLSDLRLPEDSEGVARKLHRLLAAPYLLDGHEVNVSCSIGVAVFPVDAADHETLLRAADEAVYQAKQFRNTWQRHSPDMHTLPPPVPLAFSAVRRSLDERRLAVHYQPQWCTRTHRWCGVEALVRWQDPSGRALATPDLIRLAEDAGLISAITEFVLETALRDLAGWRSAGVAGNLRLAVNISGLELRAGEAALAPVITRRLESAAVPASVLELEITESTIMRRGAGTTAVLAELKALGVRLAVDDFGVGYSSLSRLQRMPVDSVKMDRSFVQSVSEPEGPALVRAIVTMAHALRLQVTAEGVETAGQRAFLEELGCDTLQGYALGRPVPAEQMGAQLQEWAAREV